jgi:hypothetical protein
MPEFERIYHKDLGILEIIVTGDVDFSEHYKAHYKAVNELCAGVEDLKVLADLKDLNFKHAVSVEDVDRFLNRRKEGLKAFKSIKTAVVTMDQKAAAIGYFVRLNRAVEGNPTKLFRSRESAIKWLLDR